jgi:hypothetical protein
VVRAEAKRVLPGQEPGCEYASGSFLERVARFGEPVEAGEEDCRTWG